jgi:predicted AAA+ superfamily ATPase
MLHTLLNIRNMDDLEGHPKVGASWEGFMIGELIRHLGADYGEYFFWATNAGAELDLLVIRSGLRLGFEIKRTSSPKITPSIRNALTDLKLNRLDVVHAGEHTFSLAENIRAVASIRLLNDIDPLPD